MFKRGLVLVFVLSLFAPLASLASTEAVILLRDPETRQTEVIDTVTIEGSEEEVELPAGLAEDAQIEVMYQVDGATVLDTVDPNKSIAEPSFASTIAKLLLEKIIVELEIGNVDPSQENYLLSQIEGHVQELINEMPEASFDTILEMCLGFIKYHTGEVLALIESSGIVVDPDKAIIAAVKAADGLLPGEDGTIDPSKAFEPSGIEDPSDLEAGVEIAALGEHMPDIYKGEDGMQRFFETFGHDMIHPEQVDLSVIGFGDYMLDQPIPIKEGVQLHDGAALLTGFTVHDPSQLPLELGPIGAGFIMESDVFAGYADRLHEHGIEAEHMPHFPPNMPFAGDPTEFGFPAMSDEEYRAMKDMMKDPPYFSTDADAVLAPPFFNAGVDIHGTVYERPIDEMMKERMEEMMVHSPHSFEFGEPPSDFDFAHMGPDMSFVDFDGHGFNHKPEGFIEFDPTALSPEEFERFKEHEFDVRDHNELADGAPRIPDEHLTEMFANDPRFEGVDNFKEHFDSFSQEEQHEFFAGIFDHGQEELLPKGTVFGIGEKPHEGHGAAGFEVGPIGHEGEHKFPNPDKDGFEVGPIGHEGGHHLPNPDKHEGHNIDIEQPPIHNPIVIEQPPIGKPHEGHQVATGEPPPPPPPGGEDEGMGGGGAPAPVHHTRVKAKLARKLLTNQTSENNVGEVTLMSIDTAKKAKKITASKGVYLVGKAKKSKSSVKVPLLVSPTATGDLSVNIGFADGDADLVDITTNNDSATELVTQVNGKNIELTTANTGIATIDAKKVKGYLLAPGTSTLKIQKAIKVKGTVSDAASDGQIISFKQPKKKLAAGNYTVVFTVGDDTYYGLVAIGELKARTITIRVN